MTGREPAPALAVERTTVAGAPAVAVRGHLDAGAAPVLEVEIDAVARETAGAVILGLSGLRVLDHANVTLLLRIRSLLGRTDRQLAIVCPAGPVREVLDQPPLAQLLPVFDSRRAAARALVPRQAGATPTASSPARTGEIPRQPA